MQCWIEPALHSDHACVWAGAVDAHAVADAQARTVDGLRDADGHLVVELDDDVLPWPALGVLVLHLAASDAAGKYAGRGGHVAPCAAAELVPDHAAGHRADHRAQAELVVALEADVLDLH